MPDNNDIQDIAKQWIERHGNDAIEQLEQRVSELKQHKLPEAHMLWIQILEEVKRQIDKKPH